MGLDNSGAPNQYEFYNYSLNVAGMSANPQEIGNQYFNSMGSNTAQGQLYYEDFFNTIPAGNYVGLNVQTELYTLATNTGGNANSSTAQVGAATSVAFTNYLSYLACQGSLMGNNNSGPVSPCNSITCPNCSLAVDCGNYNA